jgi:alpha-acetolactate decarboxylase
MLDIDKQYVFNEQGEAIAVQIPLEQFQQIERLLSVASEPDPRSQEESEADQPEAELEYVNGVPVIRSYGGKIPASIVDEMREERIREAGGW